MVKHFSIITGGVLLIAALLFIGCPQQQSQQKVETGTTAQGEMAGPSKAEAVMHPTQGNDVTGTVTFTKTANGIQIVADISGLTPGKHGFHIHQYGDCTAADATSAGGHFAPDGNPHGAPTDQKRHVGDLGNLDADADGNAHYERVDNVIALSGAHSIIGRAVIIHGGEDDLTSQPSGNAGPRVACGVIGISK